MKRIVIISPEIPFPVFKGNQNRIHLTIEALLELGAEVHLACLNFSQKHRTSEQIVKDLHSIYPQLASAHVRRHPKMAKGHHKTIHEVRKKISVLNTGVDPFCTEENNPANFRKACRTLIESVRPDLVLVNYVKLTACIPESFEGMRVIDLHDVQSNIIRASVAKNGSMDKQEYMRHLQAEIGLIDTYDYVVSINRNESAFLGHFLNPRKIHTLPGCARTNFCHGGSFVYDIAFLGSASPFNVEGILRFDAKAMPAIKKQYPHIRVAVAGDVSTCAALKKLDGKIYTLLGRVDDVSDFYRTSKTIISPILSGAGMKVKNIEAMSFGKAIVATSFSMDGIDVVHNQSALIADDWSSFSQEVIRLLSNDGLRRKIEQGVREVFLGSYSFESKKRFYETMLMGRSESATTLGHSKPVVALPPTNAKAASSNASFTTKRTKALIFSTDAHELIGFNLFLARQLSELGVYSECVRMESGCTSQIMGEGFLVHSVRDHFSSGKRRDAKKRLHQLIDVDGNFGTLIYNEVDISDDIAIYRQMFPDHFSKHSTLDIVAHAYVILDALCVIARKIKPTFLVGWNGNGPHMVCLMKVLAKIIGIPIYHVERGLLPLSLVFDAQGVNFKSVFAGSYLPTINESEREAARKYISHFRKECRTIVMKSDQEHLSREDILSRFNVENGRGYVFFPMQIEGDSNIIINSPHYKTMRDVIIDLAYATEKNGLTLVCRPHPENKMSVDYLRQLVANHRHVHIDSSIGLHSMIKNSLATVAINSTVGLESVLHGIPTIALGNSFYSCKGITYDCACREQIESAFQRILSARPKAHELHVQTDRLERLVHLLIGEYLLFFDPVPGAAPNATKLERMLMRGGIAPSRDLGIPELPRAVLLYQKHRDAAIDRLRQIPKPIIQNRLHPGTVQYFNGVKKTPVTDELIENEFQRLYGLRVSVTRNDEKADAIIVNSGSQHPVIEKNGVVMNEFLEFLDL